MSHLQISIFLLAADFSNHLFSYTLNASNNSILVSCVSAEEFISTCTIQFSNDPRYINLCTQISGPINSPFYYVLVETLPITYYHQAIVIIDSTLELRIRSSEPLTISSDNVNDLEHATSMSITPTTTSSSSNSALVMLEVYQLGLLGLLMLILLLVSIVSTGVAIVLACKGK